jgi:hypothetical protein
MEDFLFSRWFIGPPSEDGKSNVLVNSVAQEGVAVQKRHSSALLGSVPHYTKLGMASFKVAGIISCPWSRRICVYSMTGEKLK